jgi:hypothetical protein
MVREWAAAAAADLPCAAAEWAIALEMVNFWGDFLEVVDVWTVLDGQVGQ